MRSKEWTFILILHRFLLFYLAVHQFFIPLTRLVSGASFTEAHFGLTFWLHLFFHFQITRKNHLSSKERLASPALSFVAAFSFFKLVGTFLFKPMGGFTYEHLSALLTEGSSLLFLGIYAAYGVPSYKSLKRVGSLVGGGLLALVAVFGSFLLEGPSGDVDLAEKPMTTENVMSPSRTQDLEKAPSRICGVQSLQLSGASIFGTTDLSKIKTCGLEPASRRFEKLIRVQNKTKTTMHLRLFAIKNPEKDPKLQYKGILVIEPESIGRFEPIWTESDQLFLVKSEAHPELGIQVLAKKDFSLNDQIVLKINQSGSIEKLERAD
jgi:hypothetical protein